jgi:hypothetical protein
MIIGGLSFSSVHPLPKKSIFDIGYDTGCEDVTPTRETGKTSGVVVPGELGILKFPHKFPKRRRKCVLCKIL